MAEKRTGTFTVKRGLADMLRGGVIMDVVTAEHARIAEDAGAVAVMALERVPADIRAQGGVARMSDPALIEEIQRTVTIPVMAKARIGHFAEAQVLEALSVDYIDESEVLTPADEAYHIDKWAFRVPFVCGATNLGEALRRISEGAALIRSKGEAGTGNIVEAVRHLRSILGDIRALTQADAAERYGWAKRLAAPIDLVQEVAETGAPARTAVLRRRYRHAGGRRPRDAAGCAGRLRRLGDLQERGPGPSGPGHRRGDDPLRGRPDRGQGEPRARRRRCRASRSLPSSSAWPTEVGEGPMARVDRRGASRWTSASSPFKVTSPSIALHWPTSASRRARCDVPMTWPASTASCSPAGSPRRSRMLLESSGLADPLGKELAAGLPVFGTCAGMILLATAVHRGTRRPAQLRGHRPHRAAQRLRAPARVLRVRPRRPRPRRRAAARRVHPGAGGGHASAPASRSSPPWIQGPTTSPVPCRGLCCAGRGGARVGLPPRAHHRPAPASAVRRR